MDRFIIAILGMFILTYSNTSLSCFAKGFLMDEILIRDLHQHFKEYKKMKKILTNDIKIKDLSDGNMFIDLTPKIAFPFSEIFDVFEKQEISQTSKIRTQLLKQKFSTVQQELIRARKLYPGFLKLIKMFTKCDLKKLTRKTRNKFEKNFQKPSKNDLKEIYEEADLHITILHECIDFNIIPNEKQFDDTKAMLSALLEINIFLQKP